MKLKRILSIMLVALMLVGITNVYASSSRATAPKYNVTTGANATFTGKETLTFLTDGDGVDYEGIYVDLIKLEIGEDYVMGGDNGMFKIKPEFLKTLKDGKHELTVVYVDGYALTTFFVKGGDGTAKPNVDEIPTTGTVTTGPIAPEDTTTIGAHIGPTEEQTTGKTDSLALVLIPAGIVVAGVVLLVCLKKKAKKQ